MEAQAIFCPACGQRKKAIVIDRAPVDAEGKATGPKTRLEIPDCDHGWNVVVNAGDDEKSSPTIFVNYPDW